MELAGASLSGNLSSASRHGHLRFIHHPKSSVTLGVRRIKRHLSMIRPASNEPTSDTSNGNNGVIGSNRIPIEGQKIEDLERREQEIATAFDKQKQAEEDSKKAARNVASKKTRQIKDLKSLVKDQSKKISDSQSTLSSNEDEMCRLRDELEKKDEEAKIMISELESKEKVLEEATEFIRKQEEKVKELEKGVREKERDLAESMRLREMERGRLKIVEGELEKQTIEWLSAREELKALAMQASEQMNIKETSEEFRRIRELLSDLRSELILSQQSLASSKKKMEDQAHKIQQKEIEYNDADNLLRLRESELVEARREIEHIKSEQASIMLILQEKDTEISKTQEDLAEVRNVISDLQQLLNSREEEVIEANTRLREKEDRITTMQRELDDTKVRFSVAVSSLQEIVDKLELEAAQSEAQAATWGLQKITELTRQQFFKVNDVDLILDEKIDGAKVAESGITRLFDLTEKLVKEAGISHAAND